MCLIQWYHYCSQLGEERLVTFVGLGLAWLRLVKHAVEVMSERIIVYLFSLSLFLFGLLQYLHQSACLSDVDLPVVTAFNCQLPIA
jgi:hypothetical protein